MSSKKPEETAVTVREAETADLDGVLALYALLGSGLADDHETSERIWKEIIAADDYHIVVLECDGMIISTCACTVIRNLTHGARPYAFVENVVTHPEARGRGYGTMCLEKAREIAKDNNCYKIMLMTGSKKESTLNFYRKAGFNSEDKTAFVQWL